MPFLTSQAVNRLLKEVARWAICQPEIVAAALVGSWARGTARRDSDIDLMFLALNPSSFRQRKAWISDIQWTVINAEVSGWKDKDYGVVWSRHIYLNNQIQVEFGFGLPSWASLQPIDPGTFRVVNDGCKILYDPKDLLSKLIDKIEVTKKLT
jgi:uncharacterized protein